MAKETTAKTHEDAKTAVEAAGASRKEAKAALNSFLQENELRKNVDHSGKLEQPGLQKKYDKLIALREVTVRNSELLAEQELKELKLN